MERYFNIVEIFFYKRKVILKPEYHCVSNDNIQSFI